MKKLYLLLSLIALIPLFLICSGCEKKNPIGQTNIADITDSFEGKVISTSDSLIVVRSKEELATLFDGAPNLDFDKGTLVIASGFTTYGINGIRAELQKISAIQYVLAVEITLDYTAIPQGWQKFYWITPEINSNQSIKLNTNAHH